MPDVGFTSQRETTAKATHRFAPDGRACDHAPAEAEAAYRLLFEAAPCAIAITDPEGNVLAANPAMEKITGFRVEELQMAGVGALYENPMLHQELLAVLSKYGGVREREVRLRRKDGTTYDAALSVSQVELGGQRRLFINVRDVTQQKEIEEKLRKSEEKYRMLVEQSLQGLAIIQDFRIVFCNAAYAAALGYSIEELLSLPDPTVVIHPDDREFVVRRYRDRLAGKPIPPNYEHRIIRKDGQTRWLEIYACVIDYEGKPAVQIVERDITEHKLAETELRESEERFRLIAETVDEVFWMYDAERGTAYIGPAYERIWGRSRQNLHENSHSFYDSIHPEDRERVIADHEKFLETGQPFAHEYRIVRADGSIRHIWDRGFPILDQSGKVKGRVGAAQDVTARNSAQEDLRKSEEYLYKIINCIGDPIFVKDRQHRFVLVNDASCAMMGMRREEIIGRTLHDVLPKEIMDSLIEQEERVFETGQPSVSVDEIQDMKGNRYIVMTNKTLLTDANGQKQIVALIRDISELKRAEKALRESEERYRTAIEHCNDGVVIGSGTTTLFANRKYLEIFGYDRPEEIIGKPASLIAHPDETERLEDMMLRRQRGEPVPSRYELRAVRKDGEPIDVEISAARTVYRGETVSLAFVRDITERKRAEKEKEKLQEQVRQSQKMEAIGLLAGGVAHDFNNLLNVINGYSELLLEDFDLDDPKRGDLEQIRQAGQRAAALTSQLLAFSRRQILQPKILNLNDLIADMSTMLRRMIGEDIEFVCITRPDLGLVHADPGQIQQIIMNLVVNARDAMPQGGKLSLETANVELEEEYVRRHSTVPPGPYVMLAICDNGIGMNAEVRSRIFEPFFTTKGPGRGTGLGLSTVYGIVKQSNGFIWVYSEPGKGTMFKIYLPRVPGKAAEHPACEKAKPDLRGTETILLVEDDPSVRALACRILRERGYTVIEESNGRAALRTAQEFPGKIDLVLTDVVMPEMGGKALASQMEAARPGVKTLFISGYTDNAIVHHGILESRVAFLQKPFSAEKLALKVREVIDIQ